MYSEVEFLKEKGVFRGTLPSTFLSPSDPEYDPAPDTVSKEIYQSDVHYTCISGPNR